MVHCVESTLLNRSQVIKSATPTLCQIWCTSVHEGPLGEQVKYNQLFITFRVSRRRREVYSGHARLCICLCLSAAACPHYCTDPDVTWGNGRGAP